MKIDRLKRMNIRHPSRQLAGFALIAVLLISIGSVWLMNQHKSASNSQANSGVKSKLSSYSNDSPSYYRTTPPTVTGPNYDPPTLPSTTSSSQHPCAGNTSSICIGAPSIDFYPGGTEDATNPAYKGSLGTGKEIMGRITAWNGTSLTLTTSSGQVFTVNYPVDPVTTFNTERSPHYDGTTVGLGDMIYVWYTEASTQSSTAINADQLFHSSLILKQTDGSKASLTLPPQKY